LTAAQKPGKPIAPEYISSTADSVTIRFTAPEDGGSMITEYKLEYSPLVMNWQPITIDSSMIQTITVASGHVTANEIYRFRIYCKNDYGDSDYSDELQAAIAPLPSQPSPVTQDYSVSTLTSIKVDWEPLTDSLLPLNYILYIADLSTDSDYRIEFEGTTNSVTYTVDGLTPGAPYGFKLQAVNFNGNTTSEETILNS
jgi:hypothetical protein